MYAQGNKHREDSLSSYYYLLENDATSFFPSCSDKEDSHDMTQNETVSQIQSTKKAEKRKSTSTKIAESRDKSDDEEQDSEEEDDDEKEEEESKNKKAAWVDEDDGIT